jgi:hydrogenase maturation protein HypF
MTISAVALDVRRSVEPGRIGRRFHATVAAMIARECEWIRERHGLNRVVLDCGVFLNVLLLRQTRARLLRDGFDVWHPRQVPCSDAGLALGQLAIAAAWARDQSSRPQPPHSMT